jgi:toxin ParE1/3/4
VTIRFTRDADADLAKILRYTLDEFGLSQAAAYKTIVGRALDMIESDPMRAGSRVLEQFGPQVRQFHLGSAAGRKGRAAHIVIYHVGEQGVRGLTVTVLRILHERMDPDLHLGSAP